MLVFAMGGEASLICITAVCSLHSHYICLSQVKTADSGGKKKSKGAGDTGGRAEVGVSGKRFSFPFNVSLVSRDWCRRIMPALNRNHCHVMTLLC